MFSSVFFSFFFLPYLPSSFLCSLTSEGHALSVSLAVVLDRLFSLCPEARGDLTQEEREQVRNEWYPRLAKSDQQRVAFAEWLEKADSIVPLGDVRVDDRTKMPLLSRSFRTRLRQVDEASITICASSTSTSTSADPADMASSSFASSSQGD